MPLNPLLERNLLSYSQVIHIQSGTHGKKGFSKSTCRYFQQSSAWKAQYSRFKRATLLDMEIKIELVCQATVAGKCRFSQPTILMANNTSLHDLQAVLFDMDGTLVDHFETIYRCYKYAAEKLGRPVPTYDAVKRAVGGSMPVTIRSFFADTELEAAMRLWKEKFDEIHLEGVVLLPGARDLIQAVNQHNIKAAVFTNKSGIHTRNIIESLGLSDSFSLILGAHDTHYRKPEPELSSIALDRLNAMPEQAILIGDSPFDIESAHCIGMTSYCVSTGSHSSQELIDAGADKVFESLQEIAHSHFS